jgi:hypothetical protein
LEHLPVVEGKEKGFLQHRVETTASGVILAKAGRNALCRISSSRKREANFVLWESCWGCHPKPAFCGLRRLKNSSKIFSDFSKNTSAYAPVFLLLVGGQSIKRKELKPMRKYNTPHRHRVIKTRLTEEEYAEFSERVTLCKMSQAEFIRQALIKSSIRPVITVFPVNDELLSAVGKLTAEYGKIGGNLNQIARCLNEYGAPYNALSQEVRAATAELAALKFEVLQKVGEAVGNIQTYQL